MQSKNNLRFPHNSTAVPDDIRRDMSDAIHRDQQTDKLLADILKIDPPKLQGFIEPSHKIYVWPGKRAPMLECLHTKESSVMWVYQGMEFTCIHCFDKITVDLQFEHRGNRG